MILDKIPEGKDSFDVVVIHCFTREGQIILLRKRINHPVYPGLWGFPAGKVKAGPESLLAAAQREIHEETGNRIPIEHIENTGLILPVRHTKFSGEDFYFRAHVLSLKKGRYLDEIKVDPKEHTCYKLERPESILSSTNGAMIPDARETFRMFCDLKSTIKAT